MNLFERCNTTTEQGNIAEAYAIAHFTNIGATVSKPLFVNTKYDLVVDIGDRLLKVQVKSTKQKDTTGGKYYVVNLKSSGSNARVTNTKPLDITTVDLLFVLAEDKNCWCIETTAFDARHALQLDERWNKFKIQV